MEDSDIYVCVWSCEVLVLFSVLYVTRKWSTGIEKRWAFVPCILPQKYFASGEMEYNNNKGVVLLS